MTKDDWVTVALTDDKMVVELLFRLKQSSDSSFASLPANPPPRVLPPVGWGHRQPRSKPTTTVKKELEPTRCSPTTPLSWSGGSVASLSDGYEESSRPSNSSSAGRSKGTFGIESEIAAPANKRSIKKETFAELKEIETLLLKEQTHLKRELALLHVTLKDQRARNENLKRIKLDLHLQAGNKIGSTSDEPGSAISGKCNQMEASTSDHTHSLLQRHSAHDDLASADSCNVQKEVETRERRFVLPDLNMTPFEDDSGPENLYGIIS